MACGGAGSSQPGEAESSTATDTQDASSEEVSTGEDVSSNDSGWVEDMFSAPMCGQNCDRYDPQSCAEGERCAYVERGESWLTYCRPVLGDGQVGDACTPTQGEFGDGYDQCSAGTSCFEGVCTAFCAYRDEDPRCNPGYVCSFFNQSLWGLCIEGA